MRRRICNCERVPEHKPELFVRDSWFDQASRQSPGLPLPGSVQLTGADAETRRVLWISLEVWRTNHRNAAKNPSHETATRQTLHARHA